MKAHGLVGIVVLVISEILLFAEVEPITTWFYSLAWWSYILIADSLVYRLRGESLMLNHRRKFLAILPLSVLVWTVFEFFNLRLDNWHYINLPKEVWRRWPGYFIAFATVLPAIFETAELFSAAAYGERLCLKGEGLRQNRPRWFWRSLLLGILLLVLTLLLPRYFFPAVWLGFIFLLEPVNYISGGHSLFSEVERGERRHLYSLLAAGLICGLLWEFWNFWAESKWLYSVPLFGWLKIFEMPLLGFLGFPPFALECYVMYQSLRLLASRAGRARPLLAALLLGFILAAFYAIDRGTVLSFV